MYYKITLSDIDIGREEAALVKKVIASKWFSMGPMTEKFENEFKFFLGTKFAFAVSSCTAALHLACKVMGLKKGDEVILPSLTFVATANAVVYMGATPIFADAASLDNFNISPESIEKKITPKTKAIIVMHYGGYPCDMNRIMKIAKKYNLYVVEDAAHAPGAEYKDKKLGTIGDIGCFSFFANKNLVTGEGGMIVTNNDFFAQRIKLLRSQGMMPLAGDRYKGYAKIYDVVDLGYNYRLTEIASALGLAQLRKLEKNNKKRGRIVKRYIEFLSDIPDIRIPFKSYFGLSSYHLFPILLSRKISRPDFISNMAKAGIQTSVHYPPVHLFKYYREKFQTEIGLLPRTEEAGKRVVTLPLHPLLNYKDVKYISYKIKGAV